jgi:hypothetical protein
MKKNSAFSWITAVIDKKNKRPFLLFCVKEGKEYKKS